jgi:hypothetical protein
MKRAECAMLALVLLALAAAGDSWAGGRRPQSQDWFYCPNAGAYYPYVKECAGGWQRVLPQQPMQTPSVG